MRTGKIPVHSSCSIPDGSQANGEILIDKNYRKYEKLTPDEFKKNYSTINLMVMRDQQEERPGLLLSLLQCRCPRCRRGKLFRQDNPYRLARFMQMHQRCEVCGQTFDMEPGFYYGTSYVSYALTVMISAATFIAWWVLIGLSSQDHRFVWWIVLNAILLVLLQPPLMRLSRSIWLAFFVHYSPNWDKGDIVEPDRVNKEQMNNW